MAAETSEFRTLMEDALAGCPDAAAVLCRDYQAHILRVVRRRLLQRLRTRFDSVDLVQDVWASFFAKPPSDLRFEDPGALIAYLERMAQFKVGEAIRQQTSPTTNINREHLLSDDEASPAERLPAAQPTPSQIVGAEDEWEQMLHGRPPLHQGILHLLRQGLTHREIADRLQTDEKTIQRLLRRVEAGASERALLRGILHLLRQGLTRREIADRLQTDEKTIQRLLRRAEAGAPER